MHKENKLAENVQCLSLVDTWPIFQPVLSRPNLKHRPSGPQHNAKKCNSGAPPRVRADLYLDKQIDEQSTLWYYQAEKITSSTDSGSTAAVKSLEGEEEE